MWNLRPQGPALVAYSCRRVEGLLNISLQQPDAKMSLKGWVWAPPCFFLKRKPKLHRTKLPGFDPSQVEWVVERLVHLLVLVLSCQVLFLYGSLACVLERNPDFSP
jgi:hypothetical protein